MKLFKFIVHQKNFSGEDLIINPKDYPGIKTGDVVEIYHPEDDYSRLLLQVTSFKEDLQSRETISVEYNIAAMFQLKTFQDVYMNVVNPDDVALDSVELTFKDQYLGRSEMWRLKNSLVKTCVYMNKKIEFCGGSMRCQVYEMWSQGDRVACGVITDDTKVVFRSSTSMVYLFLQMSSEMWDFDIHGDLYFEKAVNGFLADLFQKWKKNGCNHEVTIVLFSRTFYNATSLEEFPNYMKECLQQDYKGRFYEDFYRVAVQNERYEDWSNTLVQLRKLFTDYQKFVLEYHQKPGIVIPKATNSTAAQGNFLEVLNMSLNVFEKHYLDRSFDRTGQLSVVITPGVGVFEVDRELTNVTKQRIIDNGVGSDLVCVGEQPLHAVPLLKFHNKDSSMNVPDDYSMPHWINLSFYSTNKKIPNSTFVPRIKLPQRVSKQLNENGSEKFLNNKTKLLQEDTQEYLHNSFFDYDAYDAKVFQLPSIHSSSLQRITTRTKKTSVVCMETHNNAQALKLLKRKMSDPDIHHPLPDPLMPNLAASRSAAITIPPRTENPPMESNGSTSETTANLSTLSRNSLKSDATDTEISPPFRPVVGSAGTPPNNNSINHHHGIQHQPASTTLSTGNTRPGRALINPFDPSHVTIKLTSNRRRWTHIFPKGPTGVLVQQHHYQAVPTSQQRQLPQAQKNNTLLEPRTSISDTTFTLETSPAEPKQKNKSQRLNLLLTNTIDKKTSNSPKSLTLLWGATGEQEWTPALTTVPLGIPLGITDGFSKPKPHNERVTRFSVQEKHVVSSPSAVRSALDTPRHIPARSGSKVMDRGRVSPASEVTLPLTAEQQQQQLQFEHLEISDENIATEVVKIKSSASLVEILEAMKHPQTGVGFLTQHPSLPSQTFVSADAVQWLNNHMEGGISVDKAVGLMKIMIADKLICHASGDFSKPFILGYYLYHIVQDKDGQKAPDYSSPLGDTQSFENEWVEVEMRAPKGWCEPQSNSSSSSILSSASQPISIPSCDSKDESDVPVFLRKNLDTVEVSDERDWMGQMYRQTYLDIDINNKSDRIEWGHLKYQSVYKPDNAYELVVQWVAASGNIVADLIFTWQRKAQLCGIQMIPIPSDLLALPFTAKSDTLRGPIFIPLNTECLMTGKKYLFQEFQEETYAQRLFLFQEVILQRFGFMRCLVESNENIHQYVHVTGSAFVLVPSTLSSRPREHSCSNVMRRNVTQKRYPVQTEQQLSPHEAYITRHVSGKNKNDYSMDRRMGFLWSWNLMLSRKWKYPVSGTGDEFFQKKIIQDFRHFCSNGDNRLKRFWESCWELKEKSYASAK
ncbi:GATOR complex protein DEPDC5 [Copidosoma floridanum]|uniref:GATOR complex protein DEPDC5 n=1 Tax=Copidosoma floridanum TaxID=29053 RepID=UPI000C6F9CBC|nr:GATOR complex protein DEPDC5 [Copidosoma floridanum]